MTNDQLAERARQLAESHPARTPGRRAAATLYVALTTTRTPEAARRALGTFADASTRAAAATLLRQLVEREAISP